MGEKPNEEKGIISIIVAMGRNRVIGSEGELPWDLPADMKHFMELTIGHPIIMGRKTHESIGEELLGRTNIILSTRQDIYAPGCVLVHDPRDALELARVSEGGEEIFVIGGGQIFEYFLPLTDKLYITMIDHEFEGDTIFPEMDMDEWTEISIKDGKVEERNIYPHQFLIYERRAPETTIPE